MKPRALLIRGAEVFTPDPVGRTDLLIVQGHLVGLGHGLELPNWADGENIEAYGQRVFPGLIDLHVHIAGGGGEGGPWFRTPEITLSQLSRFGITTVVGVLGTDGTTRSVSELLAKARALEHDGITAWIYTGAYEVPTRTITQSARDDIILIDRVIGIGEIAISDFRGSHPDRHELSRLAGEARVGGLLSGKAGILHLHVGAGPQYLGPVFDAMDSADIPIDTFLPTHLNRNAGLLGDGLRFAQAGGFVDITTGIYPEADDRLAVPPAKAVRYLLDAGVPLERITMSSDAQGSSPLFDRREHLLKMGIGRADTLWQTVVDLHHHFGLPWNHAIAPVTVNPARTLKLPNVGSLTIGAQADVLMIESETDRIATVIAKGTVLVRGGRPVVRGTFAEGEGVD